MDMWKRISTLTAILAIAALAGPPSLSAQLPLERGAVVRVTDSLRVRQVGRFLGLIDAEDGSGTALLLRTDRGRRTIPWSSVRHVEVGHSAVGRSMARGAIGGSVAVGLLGLGLGLAATGTCSGNSFFELCGASGGDVAAVTLVGAGVGAVFGGTVGLVVGGLRGMQWKRVRTSYDAPRAAERRQTVHVALGLRLQF
jgi:hypothetical protein